MKIVIVDDHVLFREGLSVLIQQEADIEVIGLAGSVQEAVEVVRRLSPDIVLMDFNLPDGTGVEATRQIIQGASKCKVVFITMSEKEEDLLAAIRCGASGYLLKNMSPSKLVAALRSVQRGEGALSRAMTLRLMKAYARTEEPKIPLEPALGSLTAREKEILAELVAGKSNQEIAQKLVISENTVKYHVHSILDKLKLKDRKEVAGFAREHGVKPKD